MGLEFEELWVGDLLRLGEDGSLYRFEGGESGSHITVTRRGKTFVKSISDFIEVVDPDSLLGSDKNFDLQFSESHPNNLELPREIDLHISPEEESKVGNWPGAELHYQKQKCRIYLEKVMKSSTSSVVIIHGKGQGILKSEVIALLEEYGLDSWSEEHEGALRVLLST